MPAPGSVSDFLELVRKSQLVAEDRLGVLLRDLERSGRPDRPDQLAQSLIRSGDLTPFQARQLLQGRWRRFMIGGKYKLLELLGTGGMGAVYLCEHVFMRRLVALKVLPIDKLQDRAMLERFYREARTAAALNHENIVRAYDIDQFEQMHFLVLEYVDGSQLQEIVDRKGPLPVERAANYIAQATRGLQHAHEAGMVHRDIKPGNLLLDRKGLVKILDMGLARFFDNKEDNVTEKYDERTVLGTADYLAPEQGVQTQVDIRADIYSMGATLYFLLTGRVLFPEGTVAEKLLHHQRTEPTPIRDLRPDTPRGLANVVQKMLRKRPQDRYQEPREVTAALAKFAGPRLLPPDDAEMPRLSPAVLSATRRLVSGSSSGLRAAEPAPPKPAAAAPFAAPAPPKPVRPDTARPMSRRRVVMVGLAVGLFIGLLAATAWIYYVSTPSRNPISRPSLPTPPAPQRLEPADTGEVMTANGRQLKSGMMPEYLGQVCEVTFRVRSVGGKTNTYLNCLSDFKSEGNFSVKIPQEALPEFREVHGDRPFDEVFKGQTVTASGKVMAGDYQDTFIEVSDPKMLTILPD